MFVRCVDLSVTGLEDVHAIHANRTMFADRGNGGDAGAVSVPHYRIVGSDGVGRDGGGEGRR